MLGLSTSNHGAFAFGVLGNLISFLVYLAPLPTFRRVYRRKTTEGFQSVPYVVALFSAMLWIYYALLKTNAGFIVSINAFGFVVELIYIIIYLIYAPRRAKIDTIKLLLLLNAGIFGLIVLVINLAVKTHSERIVVLGWFCVGFSVSVFVAPLSIIRLVIRTRSVEYMPFYLSLSLTCSAIVWFFYGFLSHDKFVAIPNVLGFLFGLIQMVLYGIYKNKNNNNIGNNNNNININNNYMNNHVLHEQCLPEHIITIARGGSEVHPIDTNEVNMEKEEEESKECELANARDKESTEV